jgi:hypothetical protein
MPVAVAAVLVGVPDTAGVVQVLQVVVQLSPFATI